MRKSQILFALLVAVLFGYSSALHADDTDIYVSNAINNGVPNILLVMDSSASFSADAASCSYSSGGSPLSNGKAASIEQCALVDALSSLPDNGVVNIGILLTNSNNFATDIRTPGEPAYHETCQGTAGGCVVRKLALMDAAGKASLINFIKSWDLSAGQNTATAFNPKTSTTRSGGMMQEAWAYYNGKIGQSGKNYGTSVLAAGCQKNFVIFVGNAFGTSGTPGDGTVSPYSDAYGMTSAQVGATTAQLKKISENVIFSGPTCNAPTAANLPSPQTIAVPATNSSDWSENWADEWARLMFQQDAGTTTQQGTQNITTYTIGVVDPSNQCKYDYPALMTTMAKYGGGQFFRAGNASEVKNALLTILNQVQAVNSVFSSASLPVSVNADGSYLNQIYLGMFRPDTKANPRWLGNLKQYHLIKNDSGVLVQGDALNHTAINPDTGFIDPNAVSFWTKADATTMPYPKGSTAATSGFWQNVPVDQKGVLQSGYDSPDGEVVEKGGVGQQIRLESLTADFTTTAQGTSNPRRMFTYCPTGAFCVNDLTAADNLFAPANTGISPAAFGTSTAVPIVSITRSGTIATVTTSGVHGFTTTTTVAISGVTQPEYNVSQTPLSVTSRTFTIRVPDSPTTPSVGTYVAGVPPSTVYSITGMSRATHTTGGNTTEQVTVTTSSAHGFTTSSNITISGAPAGYNYSGLPTSVPSATTFTFDVTLSPPPSGANGPYTAKLSPAAYPTITAVALTNTVTGQIDGSTNSAHNLHVGESIVIAGAASNSKYNGTYIITAVPSATTFSISGLGNGAKNYGAETGTVTPNTTAKPISTLTRVATTDSATATATGLPSGWFGALTGDTKKVIISGAAADAYTGAVTITCATAGCTSFTYPITVTPSSTIVAGTATVGLTPGSSANLAAGQITRSGTTATVTGVPAGTFVDNQTLTISATGTPLTTETGYLGSWTIKCATPTDCTSFTFGPVTLSPASPASGSNMKAFSGSTPPDRDTLIRWVRGQDNFGDESGPGGSVTVRPSVHGDVLHSRPLVINYGGSNGIVVFYGTNDGVYRAVNGNQTTGNIGGVPPGGELWSLVLPEHYAQLNRLRTNSPEVKFPTTVLPGAQPKDYFVDGPTAAYQLTASDGTIAKAYIYLTMRRGGRFMYALDVTNPTAPAYLWRRSSGDIGFEELGQTWSRPRATIIQGGGLGTEPMLVFGAGYDPAQDSEPPVTNTVGRGIFVVKASDGSLVWSANSSCTTSATCLNVPGMKFAIPSDIAFVDRDANGYTDKLYFGDTGGNIWRADVSATDTASWTVTKLASLGCDDGAAPAPACSDGKAPRKFFFPPAVLPVGESGASGSFDAVSIPSGDREHPLKNAGSYNVNDKFFMVNDLGTSLGTATTSNVTLANLFDATSTPYDGSLKGFYHSFFAGEKGVNAPLATNGVVFFATNRPIDPSVMCSPNLGEAKAYAISPFLGTTTTNLIIGGGLPPSPVAGLITVVTGRDAQGHDITSEERFCIGCAAECTSCSALENSPPKASIPRNLRRTYWYKK